MSIYPCILLVYMSTCILRIAFLFNHLVNIILKLCFLHMFNLDSLDLFFNTKIDSDISPTLFA